MGNAVAAETKMAYRITADETVPDGVRRIVQEEIDSAIRLFGANSGSPRDEAIHEARKSVKKIRGALRLVRPELGKTYRNESSRFRKVGKKLSELRDAAAILEVFDQVTKKFSGALDGTSIDTMRRALEEEKHALEAELDVDEVIQKTGKTLSAALQRLKTWPLSRDGFAGLASGLESTYRSGRKALAKAEKKQTGVAYHELRKRVKDHWYHVRLLENMWTEVMQAHESSLKDLETWLGDDHNLVVLRKKLEGRPEKYGGEAAVQAFLAVAGQQQEEFRKDAVSLARRVYAEKPAVFVQNLAELWDAWHEQPKSRRKPPASVPGKKSAAAGKPKKTAAA